MSFTYKTKKKLLYGLSFIPAVVSSIAWFVYGEYLKTNSPSLPVEKTGQIFALAFHGTHAYLTQMEYIIYWTIPVSGLLIFVSLLFANGHLQKENPDWRNPEKD